MPKKFKSYIFITIGVLLVALSFYFLFLPLNIVTGGVTGISVIINHLVSNPNFKVSYVIGGLDIFLLIVGYFALGKDFFIKTIYGSLLLPGVTMLLEFLEVDKNLIIDIDKTLFHLEGMSMLSKNLTATIFGGAMMGFGLGICYKNNGSTGGMDVIQKILSKYLHFPYSKCVYLTDGLIVLGSFFVFGLEGTLFSLSTIIIVGLVADYIEMGGSFRRTALIISKEQENIKDFIINNLKRGVTISHVTGGYSGKDFDMLICTLSKTESYILRDYILSVDPSAFTFYISAREVYGDGFD